MWRWLVMGWNLFFYEDLTRLLFMALSSSCETHCFTNFVLARPKVIAEVQGVSTTGKFKPWRNNNCLKITVDKDGKA